MAEKRLGNTAVGYTVYTRQDPVNSMLVGYIYFILNVTKYAVFEALGLLSLEFDFHVLCPNENMPVN